jgi:hypothetical protein
MTLGRSCQNGGEAAEALDQAMGAAREARRRSASDTGAAAARLRHRRRGGVARTQETVETVRPVGTVPLRHGCDG